MRTSVKAILISLLLLVVDFSTPTFAQQPSASVGGKCAKIGLKSGTLATPLVCEKIGNKMLWVKAPGGICSKAGTLSGTVLQPWVCQKVLGKLKWVAKSTSTASTSKTPSTSLDNPNAPTTNNPVTSTIATKPKSNITPGAFCKPFGITGYATNGKLYRCVSTTYDSRNRWRGFVVSTGVPAATSTTPATDTATEVPSTGAKNLIDFQSSSSRWRDIASDRMTCAINLDGQTSCYGNDSYGNLGDGGSAKYVLANASRMGLVLQSEPYVSISVNSDSACAVGQSGQVYCWGANDFGQLGDGSTKSSSTPVPIKSDRRFSSVSIEGHGACGLTVNGKVLCWGRNTMGLIGDGKPRGSWDWPRLPEQISVDETFISVSTGDDFACAVSTNGDVWCWGASWGNGDPDDLSTSKPFVVRRTAGVVQVAAGHLGTCVLATNEIDCWGYHTQNEKSSFRSGLVGIFEHWRLGCSWTATDALCYKGLYDFLVENPPKDRYQIYFNTAVKKVSGTCALSETGLIKCWELPEEKKESVVNGEIVSQTSHFG